MQPWTPDSPNLVVHGDNLGVIQQLPDAAFQLIYIDPPFNTGRTQSRQVMTTTRSTTGSRVGFKGRSYDTVKGILYSYDDAFADYWEFLEPRLEEAWRLLADSGTLYLHLDYREVHYAKVVLDALFGRESFLNEIIWAYDYGARAKNKWPTKHDTILVYVKNPTGYYFNNTEVDREPYMAPGLVTPEKVALGKLPTDVWWHTIVSPTGKRRPDTRPRNPRASCAASSRRRARRATGFSTSSAGAARPAPLPVLSSGGSCSSTRTRPRSKLCERDCRWPNSPRSNPSRPPAVNSIGA